MIVTIIESQQKLSYLKSNRTAFKTDKREQHTLMKSLKNVSTVEEEDESANNVELVITDTDTSPPTIVIEVCIEVCY